MSSPEPATPPTGMPGSTVSSSNDGLAAESLAAGTDASSAAHGETNDAAFTGDTGRLPVETRRVLVQLLLGPSVDARRQSLLWPVLLRDEALLRSRLHELFLELIVDRDQRVAFTRQVVSDALEVPVLLRRASLTFLESALLLFLRQRLTQADAQGDRAVVSVDEIAEHLRAYERERNADRARFERQIVNAVEKAKTLSLLRKLRGAEERYEIAPTLKLLFSAEEIQALTRIYRASAGASPASSELDSLDGPDSLDADGAQLHPSDRPDAADLPHDEDTQGMPS